ncbi:hypothetical protein KSP39_PZI022450 [Platanthera zijinensis]|uniref:Transposase n=1 Tax=Platanthera zijinensis TaxID=2320716 RepID=A0AAP0FV31_9ASPA
MDKSWIDLQNRASSEYIHGVDKFLDYAYQNKTDSSETRIYCPCKKCCNTYLMERVIVREHIIINGFLSKYKIWTLHGESYSSISCSGDEQRSDFRDDMMEMIHEAIGIPPIGASLYENPSSLSSPRIDGPSKDDAKFIKLIEDAECPLYLLTLKRYVRNRAHPEGSIAKGYLMEECMNFCERYLVGIETKSNRQNRNYDGGHDIGRPFKKGKKTQLDEVRSTDNNLCKEVKHLSEGPDNWAWRYDGYFINGFRYRTKYKDQKRITQNSGVVLKASTTSYASSKDKNPRVGGVTYYGRLRDIFEIHCGNDFKFILFKCDWVDPQVGKKLDEFSFTILNFNHLLYRQNKMTDEPFILATQAEQICYVKDPLDPDWEVVMKLTARNSFDVEPELEPLNQQHLDETICVRDDDTNWVREGVDGDVVDDILLDVDDEITNEE